MTEVRRYRENRNLLRPDGKIAIDAAGTQLSEA